MSELTVLVGHAQTLGRMRRVNFGIERSETLLTLEQVAYTTLSVIALNTG